MGDAKNDLVRSWLTKAAHDLGSARALAESRDAYFDTAVYHCQQAAEKAMKGFLVYHDMEFGKTHDLLSLVELAGQIDQKLVDLQKSADLLTPYAVIYRYPGDEGDPDQAEFLTALGAARKFFEEVLSRIPPDTHPEKSLEK